MGYDTEFTGHVTVTPPLNADEIAYLARFAGTRRMARAKGPYYVDGGGHAGQAREPDIENFSAPPEGQPSLWCKWEASPDGTVIAWNGAEKFYGAAEWMAYLIDAFLRPGAAASSPLPEGWDRPAAFDRFTFDHVVEGRIEAEGEEPDDRWRLDVHDGTVHVICREPEPGDEDADLPDLVHTVHRIDGGTAHRLPADEAAAFAPVPEPEWRGWAGPEE